VNLEAVIEQVWKCTERPRPCELAGRNQWCLEIHFEAMFKQVSRCNWRPSMSKLGDMH